MDYNLPQLLARCTAHTLGLNGLDTNVVKADPKGQSRLVPGLHTPQPLTRVDLWRHITMHGHDHALK
ncbi:unnamed protein product [Tilletia laevis]|uniref:Uncharacterized protein n=1 Tax=Tilletia laevis TaxID=157183 RepID=A0A9N8LUM4_9BASI|nr:unnamed protein product [Tilletia laevis]